MKTINQYRNNRISVLISLIAIILFPFISNAQLNVNSSGGVSVSSVTTFSLTGFEVHAGNINLNSATNGYQINGLNALWNNNNPANIFVGAYSSTSSTTGSGNTSMGYGACYQNTSGNYNTAVGYQPGNILTSSNNSLFGYRAGYGLTSGGNNTAIGSSAGATITTGTGNTCLGYGADVTATGGAITNATAIGNGALTDLSNHIVIGNSSVTKIGGYQVWTNLSDGRFKTNVTENVKGLEFIKKLRPVTFNVDTKKLDDFLTQNMSDSSKTMHQQGMDFAPSTAMVHSGFIAQEVEKAAKDIGFTSSIVSIPSNSNNAYGLGYAEFVVPLVKAVQELSKTTDSIITVKAKQDSINTALNNQNAALQNQLNQQQKINAVNDSVNVALQSQLTQLTSAINSCCTANSSGSTKSLNDSTSNRITVNLQNVQTVVLSQNSPNPFAQQTNINYYLPTTVVSAQMLFYDMQGQQIQAVSLTQRGNGSIIVFGQDLSSGNYTYTLVADGQIMGSKKMMKQ